MKTSRSKRRATAWLAVSVLAPIVSVPVHAVPSFARQMNMQCIVCHTAFPQLTEFGRQFKLSGYTLSAESSSMPPFAFMLQPSFTHTAAAQSGGAAPGFGGNNNFAVSQASVFYSGRLFGPFAHALFGSNAAAWANKFGIFSQVTFDGAAKSWSWDNVELRFANTTTVAGRNATYGVYLNNNPTMQDPWNSTPAWSFPFSSSHLAPTPAASALIDGTLAQQVAGLGAYAFYANTVYLDVGAYRTLGAHFQRSVGVDPAGEAQITGAAPYWRVAVTKPAAGGTWEVGTFGMAANTYPGRDASAGSDRVVDVGLDSQFQKSSGVHDVTLATSWIHEHQARSASETLGDTTNGSDAFWSFKATVDYLYDKTYGLTAQYFSSGGTSDALQFPTSRTGSPASDGFIVQGSWLPLNKRGGPTFWPRSNVKFLIQYVGYNRFDGSRLNIDGSGRNARDNNTLYLEAWIMF